MSTTTEAFASTARPSQNGSEEAIGSLPPASHHELTVPELHGSLSGLGHNHRGEMVYTSCDLSSRWLSALPGLQRYCHLQRLCVDDNALTNLEAVRYMPQLTYLHARHNRLTADVFAAIAAAAAGNLERLNLDDNCIASLDGLERLPFLLEFTCRDNCVRQLPARCLSAARRLMCLSLGGNAIETVDAAAFAVAPQLRELELDGNALTSIDFLRSVTPQVRRINIANNRVRHLSPGLEQLVSLTELDVGHNELAGLKELRTMRCLKALRTLTFCGNAALEHLPHHATRGGQHVDGVVAVPSGTEYHAEVVMSDEESDPDALLSASSNAAAYAAQSDGGASKADAALEESNPAGELTSTQYESSTLYPSTAGTPSEAAVRNARDAARGAGRGGRAWTKGVRAFGTSAAAESVAAPTTAAYAGLAAPETHGFVHAVGSAARDAELNMRVNHQKEILSLSEQEQVYLWALSVLPQVAELNGRPTHPNDVAKAAFLFRAGVDE